MKKFSRIVESLDKWQDVQDYLLELTESEILKLENEPRLTNDRGETGMDFNPIIIVEYLVTGFAKIQDVTKLESYISVLGRLSNALKRSSVKFELSGSYLTIYFDLPGKLDKLMDDIAQYKKSNPRSFGTFVTELFWSDSYNNHKIIIEIKFEIDSDFGIKLDVKGLSWEDIGNLNHSQILQEHLIDHFVKKYGFKFTGSFIEDRQLEKFGKVKHWYFEV